MIYLKKAELVILQQKVMVLIAINSINGLPKGATTTEIVQMALVIYVLIGLLISSLTSI